MEKKQAAKKYTTVDEYIASLPEKSKAAIENLRAAIRKAVPKAEEVISYNMPTFMYKGGLIYYAAWKEHISLYPRTPAIEKKLKKEIAEYATSKGTLKFPLDKPLPMQLIGQIIKIRVQENEEKMQQKKIK